MYGVRPQGGREGGKTVEGGREDSAGKEERRGDVKLENWLRLCGLLAMGG